MYYLKSTLLLEKGQNVPQISVKSVGLLKD